MEYENRKLGIGLTVTTFEDANPTGFLASAVDLTEAAFDQSPTSRRSINNMSLIIRSEQLQALETSAERAFQTELLQHLKRYAPRLCAHLGDSALQPIVASQIKRSRASGLTRRGPVWLFVELTCTLGSGFVPERRAARATKLALWLTLLDTFDSAKDPHFDPAARLSAQGDGDRINRRRLQKELRQLDAELSLRASLYIANAFLRSPKAVGEMNEAIGQYIHDVHRASHLRSLVTSPKQV
jgi:hypothetical protein